MEMEVMIIILIMVEVYYFNNKSTEHPDRNWDVQDTCLHSIHNLSPCLSFELIFIERLIFIEFHTDLLES